MYANEMEKSININGVTINYEESGAIEAPSVIILHGWGCNHTTVASIANALNDKLHVFNIDLPGHGKSTEPSDVWGTIDFAAVIDGFIKKIGIKNPSVIGHSFGGRTAIGLTSLTQLHKLVLIDSAGIKPRRKLSYYYKVYSYKICKHLLKLLFSEEKGKQILNKLLRSRGSSDYLNSSPRMRAVMSKCINEDLKKLMPAITAPVLLIWGENDTATPLEDAKKMEKLIPDAGLVSFAGSGHYSFLDNPMAFKSVLREFFKTELKEKL